MNFYHQKLLYIEIVHISETGVAISRFDQNLTSIISTR